MANVTDSTADIWNAPNFVGEIFCVGANQTPFLNMIGGLSGGRAKIISGMEFQMAQPYAMESAAQPAVTEDTSRTAPDAVTYVREADSNTCQIFHRKLGATYAKLSSASSISVVAAGAGTFFADYTQSPQVMDELDFQLQAHLKQLAINVEYTFLNGAYQRATANNVAAKCRGVVTGTSTNSVDASNAALTTTLIDQLLRTMAGNGAEFNEPVCLVGAFLLQKLSSLYGFAPEDRNVGGVAVKEIVTDFCKLRVAWAPQMTATTLQIVDASVCKPVFSPVPKRGLVFYEQLSLAGAEEIGQLYTQLGLDYGPEEFHGKIINLAN